MMEKTAFSRRLSEALRRAGHKTTSPTRLALEFNLVHKGRPVTAQAVRKWLHGKAIPAQDNIVTLAEWLEVSPEWLRYGAAHRQTVAQELAGYQSQDPKLWRDFHALNEEQRDVVRAVVSALLRRKKRQQ
ncbi:MAG: transcriptional regulator [Rhodocyclaceae bacterium]|nr:transcriptional regulator [Rhodocyclaceae bacterium]